MYQQFCVLTIDPSLKDNTIVISTNRDLDATLIDDLVVELYERQSKTFLLFDLSIDKMDLILTLKESPIPNTDYILSVKNLKSIVGETLEANIKKRIQFASKIISKVTITSPVMFEQIDSLSVTLNETAEKEEDLLNSYYIEVATDNAFINTIIKTIAKQHVTKLALSKNGQYFVRARAQKELEDEDCGAWSDTISFRFGEIEQVQEPILSDENNVEVDLNNDDNDDILAPEIDFDEFKIISELPQGETPKSLVIEFSKPIDELSLENLIITRKQVK